MFLIVSRKLFSPYFLSYSLQLTIIVIIYFNIKGYKEGKNE